jgi:Holliday junction resolvasome RuvABC endonuclease subunit
MSIKLANISPIIGMDLLTKSKGSGCVIGVDPGLAYIGIAALADENTLIASATIKTKSSQSYSQRLQSMRNQLNKFLEKLNYEPNVVYFEENFNLDIKINISLGTILGRIGAEKVQGMNPKRVKKMIERIPSADKQEIINFVSAKFRVKIHCPHQADAVLIALAGMSGRWKDVTKEKNDTKKRGARIHRSKESTTEPTKVAKRKRRPD